MFVKSSELISTDLIGEEVVQRIQFSYDGTEPIVNVHTKNLFNKRNKWSKFHPDEKIFIDEELFLYCCNCGETTPHVKKNQSFRCEWCLQ